jgi:hypothetical protein
MVKKIDYFCGAFLSYLISNGISPALFEAGEKSKIVKFSTNLGDYKVYIKYSTICKFSDRKSTRKWDVLFTKKEMDILKDFLEQNRKHYFVLVCTDTNMKENEVAVLDYDGGLMCLGNDSVHQLVLDNVLSYFSLTGCICGHGTIRHNKACYPVR